MRIRILALLATLALCPGLSALAAGAPSKEEFLKGPAKAVMKDVAEVQVPEGYVFTGAKGTQALLKRIRVGNPVYARG